MYHISTLIERYMTVINDDFISEVRDAAIDRLMDTPGTMDLYCHVYVSPSQVIIRLTEKYGPRPKSHNLDDPAVLAAAKIPTRADVLTTCEMVESAIEKLVPIAKKNLDARGRSDGIEIWDPGH